MTNSFEEFKRARLFLVIGSNMTEAHPVAATFVKNAVNEGAKLIVVDPRRHPLVDFAHIHVPIHVGSDIAFLNSLMHILIRDERYDKAFVRGCCTGFEGLAEKVKDYPPARASEICGVPEALIEEVASTLAEIRPGMLCYTLGITEHTCGKNNVVSCANLQMILGSPCKAEKQAK